MSSEGGRKLHSRSRFQELMFRISQHCRGAWSGSLCWATFPAPLCVGKCPMESWAGLKPTWECRLMLLCSSSQNGRERSVISERQGCLKRTTTHTCSLSLLYFNPYRLSPYDILCIVSFILTPPHLVCTHHRGKGSLLFLDGSPRILEQCQAPTRNLVSRC